MIKEAVRRLLPTRTTKHRILGGRLQGLYIVTSWHDYPAAIAGRTEGRLLEWLADNVRPGETWLDIGAHYGYTALALSRLVGPSGRVFAFEPVVHTAGCLAQTRAANDLSHLIVLPLGLGEPEQLELRHVALTRGMADALRPSVAPSAGGEELVVVARLDWLWPAVCGARGDLHGVKIDVQGMELATLRGMSSILRVHRPKLVVELHRGVERGALLELLRSSGYEGRGTPVEPVSGEREPEYLDDRSYAFRAAVGLDG